MSDGNLGGNTAEVLKQHIEAIERLNDEVKALNEDKSERFKLAKSQGFDTKAMKSVLRIRSNMQKKDYAEQESLIDTYRHALGMLPDFEKDDGA